MTNSELAKQINQLSKDGKVVSVMQYAYLNRKSRTWAENQLTTENGWLKITIDGRNYYLKEK